MEIEEETSNVLVFCRFRPLNDTERSLPSMKFIDYSPDSRTVIAQPSKEDSEPHRFNFDYVFSPSTPQAAVYEKAARPIVDSVMQGFNGTVFAYGQTSSGKTFTMAGPSLEDPNHMGIIPRMVTTVFYKIENTDEHVEFTVKVSYCEIYMEKIRDLMNVAKDNLKIREDKARGVYIDNLTEICTGSGEEIYEIMKLGSSNRVTGTTNMNSESSRSHSIFTMTIIQSNSLDFSTRVGKLHLIDLAGSEKVGKTGAEGTRLEEAKKINKSLTALGIVITSLADGKKTHIPYRDSKLTRILENSLGGNSKTSLIVTCSPSYYNEEETISTLRFGIRAKLIKNTPKVNKEYTIGELKLLLADAKEEIKQKDKKIKNLESIIKKADLSEVSTGETEDFFGDEDLMKPEYLELIQDLEATREKLSFEVQKNLNFQDKLMSSEFEKDELRVECDNLINYTQLIYDEKNAIEKSFKEKEEQLEKVTASKDSYEAQFSNANRDKLSLEQRIIEKDVEIEFLKRKMRASGLNLDEESKTSRINEDKERMILRKYGDSLSKLSSIRETMRDEAFDENL